ncbi:MAG TPA: preprotein translocase subunit SecY [Chthonomonadales bacterium]|nr:preprotein translocase subunit SecY [Chthonomonadales bacterium]
MLESLSKALQIPELRRRIMFNLSMFAVFALGVHIPLGGIDHDKLEAIFGQGGLLGLVDVFSGGALGRMAIFAMGITPYINASIIMQMLTLAIPHLEALSKEGEAGRKQIARITRYLTIFLAAVQAIGFSVTFRDAATTWFSTVQMVVILTAGTCFLLWIGEQMTEKGIGNGVSLVIFAGIMISLPYQTGLVWEMVQTGIVRPLGLLVLVALFLGTIYGIVMITQGERRIPIQHAKRVVGMRMVQAGSSFLPIKVNTAGVIPIIFAISMLLFPAQLLNAFGPREGFVGTLQTWANYLAPGSHWFSLVIYAGMIVLFTYFYTAVVMNVQDMADNLKKYGNLIPGIRPGKPTFDYLDRVVSRVTLAGAVFLASVALVQYVAQPLTGVPIASFQLIGGTSLLIVVGVAIETMKAIEAQLLMRNYEGFIKQAR